MWNVIEYSFSIFPQFLGYSCRGYRQEEFKHGFGVGFGVFQGSGFTEVFHKQWVKQGKLALPSDKEGKDIDVLCEIATWGI